MLIFAIIALATWGSIFNGNKKSVVIQEMKQPKVAKRISVKSSPPTNPKYYTKKIQKIPQIKTEDRQRAGYSPVNKNIRKEPKYRSKEKNKIYGWIDGNGKEHYTNLEGNINKKQNVRSKREILGYTVTLSSGKKIYCEEIYKIQNGVLRIIAKSIEWQLYTSDISIIEESSRLNSKKQIRFINPDDI
ncbi:MAG: hypothetical protein D3925_01265 [Candidatus Electrothrix sp. AR5]|nr:hypothetical protein [Candidatus Electrothrix sp. AR5]